MNRRFFIQSVVGMIGAMTTLPSIVSGVTPKRPTKVKFKSVEQLKKEGFDFVPLYGWDGGLYEIRDRHGWVHHMTKNFEELGKEFEVVQYAPECPEEQDLYVTSEGLVVSTMNPEQNEIYWFE